jgi:oligopeptide transport system substrate-binding protein
MLSFGDPVKKLFIFLILTALAAVSCTTKVTTRYFGQTVPPKDNIMRYVTGGEPESLDPPVSNSQPDSRIYTAIFEGLVEYDPKTLEPIPALAESWEVSKDGTEYLFHLRHNGRFSNGDPITASDFVYTMRRNFSPELASRNAYLGYYIKYSEAYNSGQSFVKGTDGQFLLKKDFADEPSTAPPPVHDTLGSDSEFHRYLDSAERLTVPSDDKARNKLLDADAKLKAAVQGKQFIPVTANDIGIEAVDDYTLRIKLYQPAPYFLGLLGHQFFRVVPPKVIEKYGMNWSRAENIVTSGPFKVAEHKPYDVLRVDRNPYYWDAANVHLDGIEFYPLDESTTMMNLYKAGRVDALYNHTVPAAWWDVIRQYKDEYLLTPEVTTEFYIINVKRPPMDNLKVRQAFALAVDRNALAQFRKTVKPLIDMTPEGIFPKYEEARKKVYTEELQKAGSSLEEWEKRVFEPEKARALMTEAGFPVVQRGDGWECPSFPVDQVGLIYNTAESNKAVAEFVQAQWKQNLGITVTLQNMEFRTYLPLLSKVDYNGFARRGWVGDYMDPYTFLSLYYSKNNEGGTGWWDPKYDKMLDDANNTTDEMERYEKLAQAEFYISQQQIVIPLNTSGTSWMKKPYVKGMYPNPGTQIPWKFVYIEQDQAKWDSNVDNIMQSHDPAVEKQLADLKKSQEDFSASQASVARNGQ